MKTEITIETFLKTIIKGANMEHQVTGILGGIVALSYPENSYNNTDDAFFEIIKCYKMRDIETKDLNVMIRGGFFNSLECKRFLITEFKNVQIVDNDILDTQCYFYTDDSILFGQFDSNISDGFKDPETKVKYDNKNKSYEIETNYINVSEVLRPEGLAIIKDFRGEER